MKKLIGMFITVFIVGLILIGYHFNHKVPPRPPTPLVLSFHRSKLDPAGIDLHVQNSGNERLSCVGVKVNENKQTHDSFTFSIGPNKSMDISCMECSWQVGDKWKIGADGYSEIDITVAVSDPQAFQLQTLQKP